MATYTQREMEAAVALSGDLHAHRSFEEYCARQHLCEATDRWQICVQAGVALEAAAQLSESLAARGVQRDEERT